MKRSMLRRRSARKPGMNPQSSTPTQEPRKVKLESCWTSIFPSPPPSHPLDEPLHGTEATKPNAVDDLGFNSIRANLSSELSLVRVIGSGGGEVEEEEVNDGHEESQASVVWASPPAFKQLIHEMPYPRFMHISPSIASDHSFYIMGPLSLRVSSSSDVSLNGNG
ncbi:hypothetical protein CPC08DRAFT_822806 [Agrocybe pediades]|nr:hypothetical protein CPC08DRAFT_822806 [Agrocybe pediades]